MRSNLFHYNAKVVEIHEGLSLTMDIDLGFFTWIRAAYIRLNRVTTPAAVKGKSKKVSGAQKQLTRMLLNKEVTIETIQDWKNGLYLAEVWVRDRSGKRINVNDFLVESGLAQYK